MVEPERIQRLNDGEVRKGDFVLYWMQASQRYEYNHALDYATLEANAQSLPLVTFFGITDRFPDANLYALYMTQYIMEVMIDDPNVIEPESVIYARDAGRQSLALQTWQEEPQWSSSIGDTSGFRRNGDALWPERRRARSCRWRATPWCPLRSHRKKKSMRPRRFAERSKSSFPAS